MFEKLRFPPTARAPYTWVPLMVTSPSDTIDHSVVNTCGDADHRGGGARPGEHVEHLVRTSSQWHESHRHLVQRRTGDAGTRERTRHRIPTLHGGHREHRRRPTRLQPEAGHPGAHLGLVVGGRCGARRRRATGQRVGCRQEHQLGFGLVALHPPGLGGGGHRHQHAGRDRAQDQDRQQHLDQRDAAVVAVVPDRRFGGGCGGHVRVQSTVRWSAPDREGARKCTLGMDRRNVALSGR